MQCCIVFWTFFSSCLFLWSGRVFAVACRSCSLQCDMQTLVQHVGSGSRTRGWTPAPSIGMQHLGHSTTREVPGLWTFKEKEMFKNIVTSSCREVFSCFLMWGLLRKNSHSDDHQVWGQLSILSSVPVVSEHSEQQARVIALDLELRDLCLGIRAPTSRCPLSEVTWSFWPLVLCLHNRR